MAAVPPAIDIYRGLIIGLSNLPRLQEIVVSVATAKVMALHDKLETLTFPWHSHLLSLSIDTHGLILKGIL